MKLAATTKRIIVEIICLLYILLFVYAAVSKLLDFENFQVQLGQSPLLSAFAGWVSWGVVIVELVIALLLVFPRFRLVGLFAAFSLMVMFTTYIFIILNYSSFVPCSCGGILEKMGWTEHLIFNIVFVILAAAGILILRGGVSKERRISKPAALASIFSLSLFCSIGIVALLFMWSEDIIHHRNNFIRRFPHYPTTQIRQMDLKYNSYYFAGTNPGTIYLGNYTTPFQLTVVDTLLKTIKENNIQLDQVNFNFHSAEMRVLDSTFYLFDGTVPCIYKGKIADWEAKLQASIETRYTLAEPVDTNTVVFRAFAPKTGENTLGLFKLAKVNTIYFNPKLLEKQIDGVFDTDGMLKFDKLKHKVVYGYKYRNQYITMDQKLSMVARGKTIDTFSKAKIQVKYLPQSKERKMVAPPFVVNKAIAVHSNLLYVASALPGKYEPIALWETATIIDVYNLQNNSYLFSFPIYNIKKEKMKSFVVEDKQLFAIVGTHLVIYKLNSLFKYNQN
ncbi:DoxX family protein [Flavobacterium acetivorans]|uniref:DoxX family protein n=1 Tax=Flavobacterium acetivorans TaxID=2893883 RepID=UPI001E418885|nr:DoxX family protein [Flavobacterium sp. F-29]UFH36530.1 DoxX family protein [Flavobacterium sp. F-29]